LHELTLFYELVGQTTVDNRSRETIDVFRDEKSASLHSQETFGRKHVILENVAFDIYQFDHFGLGTLFGIDIDLPLIGQCLVSGCDASLIVGADYTQEMKKDAKGTIKLLLDSSKDIGGNIIGTGRVSMSPSDYPPPEQLASDLMAWHATDEEPYCKRRVLFPETHTRWITAATRGAFGAWTEECLGFCVYLSVVTGSLWVVIAKPKAGRGRIFSDFSNFTQPFHPMASNSELWDTEAVLLGEGSQM
jgi:hypothetical protein